MQTSLETLGQLERRLTMAVPLAQIEAEIDKRLARLARNAKLPGFRPGKVPLRIVAQQYGPQVRSDVISDAVQASFADAVREQNLRVAGYPRIEPKADATDAAELAFSAVFEIYPDVKLGDLADVLIERPVAEVAAADVEHTIEVLRKQRTRYEHVERPAGQGDRVIVDFTGTIEGVAFQGGQAKDFAIVVGEGAMLPEFDAAVSGLRAGESKEFPLTFPADYHGREVAGKQALFALTVKSVAAAHVPAVDAEFARAFGIASGSVDELRAEIASNLALELKRKVDAKLKEQVFTALRRKAEFALPRSLIEQEAQNMARRMAEDLRRQGMKPEDIKLSPDMFRAGAESRVALGLVLAEVVRMHGLNPKPEQVKALVRESAQTYEQPEAVVRWHYDKPERLNEFETMAVEHNVIDWFLQQVRVEDRVVPFRELMEPARS